MTFLFDSDTSSNGNRSREDTLGGYDDEKTEQDPSFDLPSYLLKSKQTIDAALGGAMSSLGDNGTSVLSCNSQNNVLLEAMKFCVLSSGKRLRPILCLASCSLFGGEEALAMPAALAVEMIHCMSLVHDDLPAMDNDVLRRGVPTCHVKYGEGIAVLAGDALLAFAFEFVAKSSGGDEKQKGLPAARILKILQSLSAAIGVDGVAGGQSKDILLSSSTPDEVIHMHAQKTAALIKVAVRCGALVAGASAEDMRRVEHFAECIGVAFQIQDDILGLTQSSAALGKSTGIDRRLRRATYPSLVGVEQSRVKAQALVAQGMRQLQVYGQAALPLLTIAEHILTRCS